MFGVKMFSTALLSLGLVAAAFGANRVGPVSQYGQLQAGKNSSGKGQIYGACKGVTSGNEVQVQGMSLFWSTAGNNEGEQFWNASTVNTLVKERNIQLIRAPMGVDEDWKNGKGNYGSNKDYHQKMMNEVVQAAIDNDIYVIIDYHSHNAIGSKSTAATFFEDMASKWGKYDNVIFEVFNEPLEGVSWSSIKSYAEDMLKIIRKYSDNLVVVGNRSWDQYPNDAASSPINDKNVAYTFHFYAGDNTDDPNWTHRTTKEGANAVSAMNSGLSVFVTEWGNSEADGDGGNNDANSATWLSWMNQHKLSGANWSVNTKDESASYFSGSAWNYSASGNWVNTNIFSKLPKSYTACSAGGNTPASSSSVASSSSKALPAGYTDYIDDFEDGDSLAYTGGVWYAYNDNENGAASSFGNATNKDGYQVVLAGSTAGNNTKNVAGMTNIRLNQGSYKYDPFVALGVKLNADGSAYDLTSCGTISYKYKGAAHNFKAEDTAVEDYGYHQIQKSASSSWTEASVDWDMLLQESWADPVSISKSRISRFTWEVKGTQPSLNYLYVDDVRCDGVAIKKVVATSSSSNNSSSSSAPIVTTAAVTSGSAIQSVVAGNAIAPIVISYSNATGISVKGLPSGLKGSLNETAKTYTISGTVNASLGTKDYAYTVAVAGPDNNTEVKGTIKVTRAPVVTTFKLTSGNSTQSVVAGNAIVPIVYSYENVSSFTVKGLPEGLNGSYDASSKTYTISGTVDAKSATYDYNYIVSVTGPDNNAEAKGTIEVTAAPQESSSSTEKSSSSSAESSSSEEKSSSSVDESSSSEQSSSSSEKSSSSSAESSSSEEKSSSSEAESSSSVQSSSSSEQQSSSSVEVIVKYQISGSLEQTVERGGEIETITISGFKTFNRLSWNINFLQNVIPQQASSGDVVISGKAHSWAQVGSYTEKLKVDGEEILLTLHVVEPIPSSSSVKQESSSSSSDAESSSSGDAIEESSSSINVEDSSSSEVVESSSSSDEPESSSSSDLMDSSSSSQTDYTVASSKSFFQMGFAHNELNISVNRASDVSIQVFDMMGNVVMTQRVMVQGNYVLSMGELRQGNYMVRVTEGRMSRVARVAIK